MPLTLLIDLDDTLIGNKMDTFLPAYLGALGQQLAAYIAPHDLSRVMMAATRTMFQNNRPDRTLKTVFDADFYPVLSITEDDFHTEMEQFYAEIFPAIGHVIQPRPAAVHLLEAAFDRGWSVAIATNPLFPRPAILQRLVWGEISCEKYPYAAVSAYETYHFAKPNPAYFAELLGQFGWPSGPVVMIGNDPRHDIAAAQAIGIPTFWISNGQPYPDELAAPNASGTLDDILPWLDTVPEDELLPDYTAPSAIAAILRGIPAAWLTLTANLSPEIWLQRPQDEAWSLTEIICHLRDVEQEINLPRLKKMVQEDTPFIPGVESDLWVTQRDYQSQDGPAALQDFVAARMQTLAVLVELAPDDWQRPVQHAIFGPATLREIASFMAAHDRLHIRRPQMLFA